MRKRAIICDLDGTICNTDHRQHLVQAKKWDEFYEALSRDSMNDWCNTIVFSMWAMCRIETIFVSGRPEKYRSLTEKWFKEHWAGHFSSRLFMRKDNDFRKDAIIKEEIYRNEIEPHWDVQFCIDDRQQVVDMWRSLGLVCLQCAKGDF